MAAPAAQQSLSELYEVDETAWLEQMARLVAQRRMQDLDAQHLSQYLADMARRDKREVLSRLVVLLTHLLKWENQPDKRTNSWQATISSERNELGDLLESGTLRNHAQEILTKAYERAVKQAVIETGLAAESFPAECPFAIDALVESGE